MGNLYKKHLDFGTGLHLVNGAAINSSDSFNLSNANTKYYILHYFLADCDKCIDDLIQTKEFIRNHPLPDTKYVFLADGPTNIYLKRALAKINFPYPVFYETGNFTFKIRNRLKLEDQLYNTMLMDNLGEVILFGSYYQNGKAQDLFEQIITCK